MDDPARLIEMAAFARHHSPEASEIDATTIVTGRFAIEPSIIAVVFAHRDGARALVVLAAIRHSFLAGQQVNFTYRITGN